MGVLTDSRSNFQAAFLEEIDRQLPRHLPGNNGLLLADQTPVTSRSLFSWIQSVIGIDDRRTRLFTRKIPERLICALIIHAAGKTFHGTGWLAAPDLVVTCGHNVHHDDFGGWAVKIEVVPGQSEAEMPFGVTTAERFSAHRQWVDRSDADFDVGCLHLDTRPGDALGWFAIGPTNPERDLAGQELFCAGYPEFQGQFTRQRTGAGKVVAASGTRLFHDADTNDGQSGGPIWLAAEEGSPPAAIAVHCYEKIIVPGVPPREANSGTLIDAKIMALIESWKAATPAA